MKQLKQTQQLVYAILKANKKARNSDYVLYLAVIEKVFKNASKKSISDIFINQKKYNLPLFETVSRARRKIQQDYLELQATETVVRKRRHQEKKFREFYRK